MVIWERSEGGRTWREGGRRGEGGEGEGEGWRARREGKTTHPDTSAEETHVSHTHTHTHTYFGGDADEGAVAND
jgi:hypothetical protein